MTIERNTSPLPKGRYWITIVDTPEGQIEDFDSWLHDVKGSVKVETSELDTESDPHNEFIIFNVTGPGAFLAADRFGFPNKAPNSIKSRQDTEQAPDVEEPSFSATMFKVAGIAVGIGVVLAIADMALIGRAKGK